MPRWEIKMHYLIFALTAVVSACLIFLFCNYQAVFETSLKLPRKKTENEEFTPFSEKSVLVILPVLAVLFFVILLSLYKNTVTLGIVKLYSVLLVVVAAGIVDLKKKIIPNLLIIFGLSAWVLISAYELLFTEGFKSVFISELIGFAVGFVLLGAVSVLTKGSLGMGDVKLFGIIGLVTGVYCTYSTLLVSLLASVVVSVIGLATKKVGRKDTIPFGPCIMLGYIVVLFLASY